MPEKPDNFFIERRAHALAMVLLTSRDDLSVMSVPQEPGIDLLVSIIKNGQLTFRQFGVILKGSVYRIESTKSASQLLDTMMSGTARIEALSTPICIFLFSMSGNQGFYAWRDEPTTSDGHPRLRKHKKFVCKQLN